MYLHCLSVNEDHLIMTYLILTCVLVSSLSFMGYSISYFTSPHMKNEFERFKLKKFGLFVIILQILAAFGLLAGLLFTTILLISSGGLALLMLLGLITRIKSKDSFLVCSPTIFYMSLNSYIYYLGSNQ